MSTESRTDRSLLSGDDKSLIDAFASLSIEDENFEESRKKPDDSESRLKKVPTSLRALPEHSAAERGTVFPGPQALPKPKRIRIVCVRPPYHKASKGRVGYLDLPGEIRNQIMDYALVPGRVLFSAKVQPVDFKDSPSFVPGCQLLATCRQAYDEGHVSFYINNIFHLAPGPLSESVRYFGSLNRRHQDMIRSVSIDMSIVDLTPPVLERIQTAYHENLRQAIADADHSVVKCYVVNALRDLWTEKIAGVRDAKEFDFIRLERMIYFRSPACDRLLPLGRIQLKGNGITKLLSPVNPNKDCQNWGEDPWRLLSEYRKTWDDELCSFFMNVVTETTTTVVERLKSRDSMGRYGWEGLKEWLNNLGVLLIHNPFGRIDQHSWCEKSGWTSHTGYREL